VAVLCGNREKTRRYRGTGEDSDDASEPHDVFK